MGIGIRVGRLPTHRQGIVRLKSRFKEVTRDFANIAEAGLGAATVARTGTLPRSLGAAKYFAGFWLTLPGFHPAVVRLDADDSSFEWRAHNVVVANCPQLPIEADGETLGTTPTTFEVVPNAIQLKV
jgi:diacylglycerol kinase family enzyme